MEPKVDWFFDKAGRWQEAFARLRDMALASGLTEELKWGHPCYTLNGKNVFLIHGFKDHCAVLFHKGALLKDPKKQLVQQTKNVQSVRQMRFTSEADIMMRGAQLKAFIKEAIANERAGKQVEMKTTAEFEMPAEFATALKQMPELNKAFKALTPGRQRGYLLHFAGAKQAATRLSRIEKHVGRILAGKGLDDPYIGT